MKNRSRNRQTNPLPSVNHASTGAKADGGMVIPDIQATVVLDAHAVVSHVTVYTRYSGEYISTASSKVHGEDDFNPQTGELYALGRALEKLGHKMIKQADGLVANDDHNKAKNNQRKLAVPAYKKKTKSWKLKKVKSSTQ